MKYSYESQFSGEAHLPDHSKLEESDEVIEDREEDDEEHQESSAVFRLKKIYQHTGEYTAQ